MKAKIPSNLLRSFLSDQCSSQEEFVALRREITYNMATANFLAYFLNFSPKLDNFVLNTSNGSFFLS